MKYKLLKTNKHHEAYILKGNILVAHLCRDVPKKNWYVFSVTKKVKLITPAGIHSNVEDAFDAFVKYHQFLTDCKAKKVIAAYEPR